MTPIVSPRGSLHIERPEPLALRARFSSDFEALAMAREQVERQKSVVHRALAPVGAIAIDEDAETLEVMYGVRASAAPLGPTSALVEILSAGADVAEALDAYAGPDGKGGCTGYLDPRLILVDMHGAQLVAVGLWQAAYAVEAATTGRAMMLRRFVTCPDWAGAGGTGPDTVTYFVAYFLYEILCGHEPFRTDGEVEYMRDVFDGRILPPVGRATELPQELSALLVRSLSADRSARPTLAALAAALRRLAAEMRRAERPWWKFW